MKYLIATFFLLSSVLLFSQGITGKELLKKAIAYHDPKGQWASFKGTLFITMDSPDRPKRDSEVSINTVNGDFFLKAESNGTVTTSAIKNGQTAFTLNGSSEFTDAEKNTHRLTDERVQMMKNYYTYLYGLPMKLTDAGTIINPIVTQRSLEGKTYLVLKVNYDPSVGKDTWYFYFNPETYALEAYQFYHDEAKNDGEYILLSGTEKAGSMLLPKIRTWFTNAEKKLLGTDTLHKVVFN